MIVEEHPYLDARALRIRYPGPLGELATPPDILTLLAGEGEAAPLQTNDEVRKQVRDLLRHGGFKPTGRNKPASEYLARAAADGRLGSINLAVDLGNAVSLHSGLPISVVDTGRLVTPTRVAVAPSGSSYAFNRSGQVIDVSGLLCLIDGEGPCANAVKDAQRTKTDANTRGTLSILWGSSRLPELSVRACNWYTRLAAACGAEVERAL